MTGGTGRAVLRIDPADTVCVALRDLANGEVLDIESVKLIAKEEVPRGHKIAIKTIDAGERIIKYGSPIGVATERIDPGRHVHSHNCRSALGGAQHYTFGGGIERETQQRATPTSIRAYRRKGGIGIRNDLWIIPTVGCVNRLAENIAMRLRANERLIPGVDSITALTHPYGCSQVGDDLRATTRILSALASHPNAGAVMLVGLGCENCRIESVLEQVDRDRRRLRWFYAQEVPDELEHGVRLGEELLSRCAEDTRSAVSMAELTIGLKCGGSDAFSGTTANPLVGRLADLHAACGGRLVISEVPEMFGGEHLLLERCYNHEVFQALVSLINSYKDYYISHDVPTDKNPSPGNIQGGITTLDEKSLGCVRKAGRVMVRDVIDYGDRVRTRGLSIVSAPGNDLVSSTALAAAGAHCILFTTGRGTAFGSVVPTIKISSNSDLARRKPHWIDFDAGLVAESGGNWDTHTARLGGLIRETAEGKKTRNEERGYREIALFKRGVTV